MSCTLPHKVAKFSVQLQDLNNNVFEIMTLFSAYFSFQCTQLWFVQLFNKAFIIIIIIII